ncbi:hypothetical protein OJAV_G00044330 [Oryzias javanicus]|uniref:G-protein coupled receptors family 1 profile domain-containing protein n=1 Tax=Oryzias javanicus TaxID=123683 RepID=A0A437DDP6_ORYJA|nr:hypothetical protein OJAV_G00044330 [Oryzias javanicus]
MSRLDLKQMEHEDMIYTAIETAIALASVMGNVLIVAAVCVNRALRNPTFSFIASLAGADIAVGLLAIPVAIVINWGIKTQFYTCLFLSCLVLVITQSSILSLLAIAIDRFLRIKIPTRYNDIVTQKRAYVAVCLCWILSFLCGFVPMMGWNNHASVSINNSSEITCNFTAVIPMDYMVYFNFFGCVVVPLSVMILLYLEIFRVIRKQLNRRAEATCDASKYYRKELKLAKSLALVFFLFIICWLPIHIVNCFTFFDSTKISKLAVYVGILLSHGNSAINPMVYAFRIKTFRLTVIQIIRRSMLCKYSEPITPHPSSTPGFFEKQDVKL